MVVEDEAVADELAQMLVIIESLQQKILLNLLRPIDNLLKSTWFIWETG